MMRCSARAICSFATLSPFFLTTAWHCVRRGDSLSLRGKRHKHAVAPPGQTGFNEAEVDLAIRAYEWPQIFTSSNPLTSWMRRIDALRTA